MQLKWLRVLLPKMEDIAWKESFANAASNVCVKTGAGRKQTARKTAGLKKSTLDHTGANRQEFALNQHLRKSEEPTEICGDFEGCRKDINEMLMFCVKCKDIQQFSFTELQQHCRQYHSEDKPLFVCSRCGFTIDDADQMNAHAISHKMDNILNTMQSENREASTVEGKLAKRRHLKPNTMYCNKCRFSTKDPLQFQKHILRHEEIQYKCGRCDRVCYTRGEFQRHSVQHTGTFPFKCRYCDYGAVRKDYVVKHTKGVHRDIIKNGGSVLVLPMRKGSKKKAVSKIKNVLKVRKTGMEQSENSANVGFQNLERLSLPLTLKSANVYSEMKDLDNVASLQSSVNTSDIESLENSTVKNTNILNCSSIEASKIQLNLHASSKHTVQPGAPLTLVAPAQMVIPSNCLAQLVEIKTVNEKQQLVFKIIPSTSVPVLEANASGVIAKPSKKRNSPQIVELQKCRASNHPCTLLTNHVDPTNELLQLNPVNKIADSKQNAIGQNANFIISRPLSIIEAESVSNKMSVLQCRSEDSAKANGREENLTSIRASSENQLTDDGLVYEQLEKGTDHSNHGKMTAGEVSFGKPFAGSVHVTNKTKMFFCNAQIAKDSRCESLSKAVVSFPSNRTQQNMQLCTTSPNTLVNIDKDSELAKSSTNCTTQAAENSDKQIAPNFCIEQTKFISNKMFQTNYSKRQTLSTLAEQSIGMETCNSSKIHKKCLIALKECSNTIRFNSQDCSEAKCVNNPYPSLETGGNSRNKLYLSVQDSNASKHKQINVSTDKSKSRCCNHTLTTQAQSQSPQNTADVYANGSSISTFLNEVLLPVGDKTENKHSLSPSSLQPAGDSKVSQSQDSAISAEVVPNFSNQDDLIRADTIDDPSVSTQWPIISSVFSLSCGSNDVPEAIRWDNEYKNTCSPSNSAQEKLIGSNSQSKSDSQFVKNGNGTECQTNCLFASSEHTITPTDHFYAIQPKAENVITDSGQKERNKNFHLRGPSQKYPQSVSTCGNIDLNTTSVQLVTMLNGNSFHLHNGSKILAEHSSLLPSLLSPIAPVEIDDHSSAYHSKQLPDNVHVYRDVSHVSSGYSKKSNSFNLSLGSSVISSISTEGRHTTKMDSFVQRIETNDMSDSNVIPLSTVTRTNETNCPSVSGLKTNQILSSEPGTFQNKVMPGTVSSTISELGIPSVSPNFSDTTLVASMPCGISPCGLKPQRLSSVNPYFTIENQMVMPLSNNSESNIIPNSRRIICSSPEELQEGKTGVASSSFHGLSLQSNISSFVSNYIPSADSKSGNTASNRTAQELGEKSYNFNQTMQRLGKVIASTRAKQQKNSSLSSTSVVRNPCNFTKSQLSNPSIFISKPVSIMPLNIEQNKFKPEVSENSSEHTTNILMSQNTVENRLGQKVSTPHQQSSSGNSCVSALLSSTKCCIDFQNASSHFRVKHTLGPGNSKQETTYRVVPSGIVLKVLNSVDVSKQEKITAATVYCQSLPRSKNLHRLLCPTPTTVNMNAKSVLKMPSMTKKQKASAKAKLQNNCSVKATNLCDQSFVSAVGPNPTACNTASVKTVAHHKSQMLKCGRKMPLNHRNMRKRKFDQMQDNVTLKKTPKSDICPVFVGSHELLKTARRLRLRPFNEEQLVKCPRRNQPVVVLNHPDVDASEVINVMQTIGKYKGHVLKVVLSQRTVISLRLKEKHQKRELRNRSKSIDKRQNCRVVSPIKERHMLKMKLKKIHKNNYQIVKNVQNEFLQIKFRCWFCGRMFCNQEEWIAHGQRHLMEATRDWNDVTTVQENIADESRDLDKKKGQRNPI